LVARNPQQRYLELGGVDGPAENARFSSVQGLATDAAGNVYVSSGQAIRKISTNGTVSTFAGDSRTVGYADGAGADARFWGPGGLAFDAAGNLFVSDAGNSVIRKITPDGLVSTFAGTPQVIGYEDGPGSSAKFKELKGIAFDAQGNLLVCDMQNHRIRKITPDGLVSTIAGSGNSGNLDGTGISASFTSPNSIVIAPDGNMFVSENAYIRKITPTGVVTTIAGSFETGYVDGAVSVARFNYNGGIALDTDGNLYVSDQGNNLIRKITPAGMVSTYAGKTYMLHQNGPADMATFTKPGAMAKDAAGNIYVCDLDEIFDTHVIRKITPDGTVSLLAGGNTINRGADGQGADAGFAYPSGIVVNTDGNIYITDLNAGVIRKITPDGLVSTFAGKANESGYTDGQGTNARFGSLRGITADAAGNLFVTDGNGTCIRKISPSGMVSLLAGTPGPQEGLVDGTGTEAQLSYATGIAMGPDGNVYFTDQGVVRRVTPAGVVTSLGIGASNGSYDNKCLTFTNQAPNIAFDAEGSMYLTIGIDLGHSIRKLTRDGLLYTLAGEEGVNGYEDGDYKNAKFYLIGGMVFNDNNEMVIADGISRRIRKLTQVNATGYQWSTGETTGVITIKQNTALALRVLYNGCSASTVDTNYISFIPKPNKPVISYHADTLDFVPGDPQFSYIYTWYLNDTVLTVTVANFISGPLSSGVYKVSVQNANGCEPVMSDPFAITGLQSSNALPRLQIVPNPTNGIFRIAGFDKPTAVHVLNNLGQAVYTGTANSDTYLNLQSLPAGIYRLFAEGGRQVPIVKTN
ncbi:MAG: T9SS type A sorting domain-containing protein, partial [Bacteroidota bacterium]